MENGAGRGTRQFRVGIIDVEQRPTVIHGLVLSGSEIIGAGRIETIGSNDDDSQNTLKLVRVAITASPLDEC